METTEEIFKKCNALFLERGFTCSYFYEKGGDSSCVYICRFARGADYFDFRETSGRYELNIMVYGGGEYRFPNLRKRYQKEYFVFRLKRCFRRIIADEWREFYSALLEKEWQSPSPDFFGIKK